MSNHQIHEGQLVITPFVLVRNVDKAEREDDVEDDVDDAHDI
jgi:hypothetical protein